MQIDHRIAEFLLDIGAVSLSASEPFTWSGGFKAPIRCDCSMIYGHPEARDIVAAALAERVKHLHIPPDVIAASGSAAIGWAALVADRLDLPLAYVDHGDQKRIGGDVKPHQHAVVIGDLIATGQSCITAARALREAGKAMVTDAVSIFSCEFAEAREAALEEKLHLHPLSGISILLQAAAEQDRLTAADAKEILRFVKEPQEWQR